jgi:hypothetical protein
VSAAAVYQERYRWSRRTIQVVAVGALAVLASVGLALPVLPTLLLVAGGLLALVWGALNARVALRVDARGVTFGRSRRHLAPAIVPWADISAIVLWQQRRPEGSAVSFVGLLRRPGPAPELGTSPAAAGTDAPEIPPDVIAASRPVRGWQLDRRDLARAAARLAPDVQVLDYDTGQRVTAGERPSPV